MKYFLFLVCFMVSLNCTASINVTPSEIVLLTENSSPHPITVTNTSNSVTYRNIQAHFFYLEKPFWPEVQQDANDCKILEPNSSCTIYLTVGKMIPDQKNILVYGDTGSSATIKITIDDLKTAKLVLSSNNIKNGMITLSRHNDRWQEVQIEN